jgi:hypothetical protein
MTVAGMRQDARTAAISGTGDKEAGRTVAAKMTATPAAVMMRTVPRGKFISGYLWIKAHKTTRD